VSISDPEVILGADTVYLSELSPKDKGFDFQKRQSGIVADLYSGTEFDRYSERISNCNLFLGFELGLDFDGLVSLKLSNAGFCKVRHCIACQSRGSFMWRTRFFHALPKILEDYSSSRYIFLTLTVKNPRVEDLRAEINLMNKAWQRLIQRKVWPALGTIKSIEVTRERDKDTGKFTGYAHPHIHAVLMVRSSYFANNYISHTEWMNLWKDCLRVEYDPVVHIKAINPRNGSVEDTKKAIIKSLFETFKYTIKPQDLIGMMGDKLDSDLKVKQFEENRQWLVEITKQMHAVKSFYALGCFKNYLRDDIENLDFVHDADDSADKHDIELGKIWFGWKDMLKRYIMTGS
jgi:plasmid rolling circle replication initiator protein Rep